MQAWTWQTPGLMLKLSIFFFVAGLACLIWERAMAANLHWGSGELKVSICTPTLCRSALLTAPGRDNVLGRWWLRIRQLYHLCNLPSGAGLRSDVA